MSRTHFIALLAVLVMLAPFLGLPYSVLMAVLPFLGVMIFILVLLPHTPRSESVPPTTSHEGVVS